MSYLPMGEVLGQPNMGTVGQLLVGSGKLLQRLISWILAFTREQHTMASWWSPH